MGSHCDDGTELSSWKSGFRTQASVSATISAWVGYLYLTADGHLLQTYAIPIVGAPTRRSVFDT